MSAIFFSRTDDIKTEKQVCKLEYKGNGRIAYCPSETIAYNFMTKMSKFLFHKLVLPSTNCSTLIQNLMKMNNINSITSNKCSLGCCNMKPNSKVTCSKQLCEKHEMKDHIHSLVSKVASNYTGLYVLIGCAIIVILLFLGLYIGYKMIRNDAHYESLGGLSDVRIRLRNILVPSDSQLTNLC